MAGQVPIVNITSAFRNYEQMAIESQSFYHSYLISVVSKFREKASKQCLRLKFAIYPLSFGMQKLCYVDSGYPEIQHLPIPSECEPQASCVVSDQSI
jgi:hypothetical protein